jgi:IS5 family transposase
MSMDKQLSLSALSDELSQVRTKKREFLAEIDRIVPWEKWISIIKPYYYKGERGNEPYDLERMLRIYLVQNLYNLSDMAAVAEVIDSRAFSDFCGVESSNQVPDGDTLGRFRNILLRNGIQQELFAQVVELLMQRGLILKRGTIVDSTFIEAPSSTKNEKKERDPQAHSAKKGNTWHFGYKAHIGVDKESGLVHTVKVTAANEHDVTVTSELLTGEEEEVYGDSGYLGAEKRPEALKKNKAGKSVHYKINRRPSQSKNKSARSQAQIKRHEHEKSSVRAKVEHVFAVVKLQLRFRKTRYRGLRKQIAKMNIMFALANLILADRPCLAA